MPNAYVFPGGVLAESDSSDAWLELFQSQGFSEDDLQELVLSIPEFQELVQTLYENISQPKTVMQIEEKADDEQEVVRKRKGPSVAKGLKDEEILREMRSLVISADPWDIYSMVNDVRILIFFCFDHHQALL